MAVLMRGRVQALCVAAFVAAVGCVQDLEVLGSGEGPDAGSAADASAADGGPADGGPMGDAGAVPQVSGRTLAAGDAHTCALVGGTLWCWGGNGSGQLGLDDVADRAVPEVVGGGAWVQLAAGAAHTCATRDNGSVWCWGANSDGQLGVGDTAPRATPTESPVPMPAHELATKQDHTCVIAQDRSLFCWGQNGEGEIGLDDWPPVFVITPARVTDSRDWDTVSTGQGHTLGLRGGALYGWGRNTSHQLGLGAGSAAQRRAPTFVSDGPWREVSAGQNHSCAISAAGALWCWGDNFAGQLGTGDRTNRDRPALVDGAEDWIALEVDTFHGCGLRAPGSLWCWGRNVEGQLGTGDLADRLVPTQIGADVGWAAVAVGRFHTCAQRADQTVWCMGANDEGRLGSGDGERRNLPTQVDVLR